MREGHLIVAICIYISIVIVLLVRPVSARYMHYKEIAAYEEESAKTEDR